MTTHLKKREARLLRRESYIRRTRHVCFWFGVLAVVMSVVTSVSGVFPEQQSGADFLILGAFMFLCAYTTNLQVRHIESIKAHRREDAT